MNYSSRWCVYVHVIHLFHTDINVYGPRAVVHVHEMCSTCNSTNIAVKKHALASTAVRYLCGGDSLRQWRFCGRVLAARCSCALPKKPGSIQYCHMKIMIVNEFDCCTAFGVTYILLKMHLFTPNCQFVTAIWKQNRAYIGHREYKGFIFRVWLKLLKWDNS